MHRFLFSAITSCFLSVLAFSVAHAQEPLPETLPLEVRQPIGAKEKAKNFGIVGVAQVVGYFATQDKIIKAHGSWENWMERPTSPHFDKDSFDFNLGKHSFVGQYYFLFYRSRGYTERDAFLWSFASSLLFEFGIETATEKPSYQDMYQTPVFGTVVGMGAERLSAYFHSGNTWPTTFLGYLFNPFGLLPGGKCACSVTPTLNHGKAGFVATLNF